MYEQDVSPVQVAHRLRVSTKSAYQWRRCWRAQYRPAFIDGFLAQTGLALKPEPP
jgi:transposase-like protein